MDLEKAKNMCYVEVLHPPKVKEKIFLTFQIHPFPQHVNKKENQENFKRTRSMYLYIFLYTGLYQPIIDLAL